MTWSRGLGFHSRFQTVRAPYRFSCTKRVFLKNINYVRDVSSPSGVRRFPPPGPNDATIIIINNYIDDDNNNNNIVNTRSGPADVVWPSDGARSMLPQSLVGTTGRPLRCAVTGACASATEQSVHYSRATRLPAGVRRLSPCDRRVDRANVGPRRFFFSYFRPPAQCLGRDLTTRVVMERWKKRKKKEKHSESSVKRSLPGGGGVQRIMRDSSRLRPHKCKSGWFYFLIFFSAVSHDLRSGSRSTRADSAGRDVDRRPSDAIS